MMVSASGVNLYQLASIEEPTSLMYSSSLLYDMLFIAVVSNPVYPSKWV